MTGDKSLFHVLEGFREGVVKFGDGSKCKVYVKGSIKALRIPKLHNVLNVEGLKEKVLIITQLCDSNCVVHFSKASCSMLHNQGNCIINGDKTSENFHGTVPSSSLVCNMSTIDYVEL